MTSAPATTRPRRWRTYALIAAFLVAMTLLGGTVGPKLFAGSDASHGSVREYSDLLATARAWYADELPADKLVYASIQGMLSTLDPHTNFLEPEEYSVMQEKQRGSFYGLGIIISKRNGKITVITPVEGSPADRLGIRAGDRVAYLGPNHPAFVETMFGVTALGAVLVPLNTRLAARELSYMVVDAGVDTLVWHAKLEETAREEMPKGLSRGKGKANKHPG